MRLGFLELAVILAIILLIVGPKQIPKLSKSVKSAMKDFKDGYKEDPEKLTQGNEHETIQTESK